MSLVISYSCTCTNVKADKVFVPTVPGYWFSRQSEEAATDARVAFLLALEEKKFCDINDHTAPWRCENVEENETNERRN